MLLVAEGRSGSTLLGELAFLAARYGRVVDFSPAEEGVLVQGGGDSDDDNRLSAPAFLEGTGSLVLDHINRVAYVAASERSDVELTEEWAAAMGFNEVVAFDATDADGRPIYHTNVVMAIGTSFAVVCTEAIADASQRERVLARLRSASKEVVQISRAQMGQFCGNVLELLDGRGRPFLALSVSTPCSRLSTFERTTSAQPVQRRLQELTQEWKLSRLPQQLPTVQSDEQMPKDWSRLSFLARPLMPQLLTFAMAS